MKTARFLLLLVASTLFVDSPLFADDSLLTEKELRAQYQAAAAKWKARLSNMSGKFRRSEIMTPANLPGETGRQLECETEFFVRGDSKLFLRTVDLTKSSARYIDRASTVGCTTPTFGFYLKRKQNQPFELDTIFRDETALFRPSFQFDIDAGRTAFAPCRMDDMNLEDLLTKPGYMLKSLDSKENLIQLHFDIGPNCYAKYLSAIDITLDRKLDFAIRKYVAHFKQEGDGNVRFTRTGAVEYQRIDNADFAVPKTVSITDSVVFSKEKTERKVVVRDELIELNVGGVKEDRFTLASFGLPEQPREPTGKQLLDDALAQAALDDKLVFVSFCRANCGGCESFRRYHADATVQKLLATRFEIVVVDIWAHVGGSALRTKYADCTSAPAWAILDSHGKLLSNSILNGKNTGYPEKDTELNHYFTSLKSACPALSQPEIDSLKIQIKKHSKTK